MRWKTGFVCNVFVLFLTLCRPRRSLFAENISGAVWRGRCHVGSFSHFLKTLVTFAFDSFSILSHAKRWVTFAETTNKHLETDGWVYYLTNVSSNLFKFKQTKSLHPFVFPFCLSLLPALVLSPSHSLSTCLCFSLTQAYIWKHPHKQHPLLSAL